MRLRVSRVVAGRPGVRCFLGPVTGGASSMPAKQCVGGDEPAVASWSGERGGDRGEERSVVVVEGWPVGLSAEDLDLMAQHDDLEVLGPSGADREAGQRRDEGVQNSVHEPSGSVNVSPGQHPRPNIRPPQASSSRSWVR